jgi:hypothetical protein
MKAVFLLFREEVDMGMEVSGIVVLMAIGGVLQSMMETSHGAEDFPLIAQKYTMVPIIKRTDTRFAVLRINKIV